MLGIQINIRLSYNVCKIKLIKVFSISEDL